MSRPVLTFGQETFSSSAATSGRSPKASTSGANSSAVPPITLTMIGTGRWQISARSSARKRSMPLLGRPIELIIPAPSSHSRGGGLPARGASVTVLVT